MSWRKYFARRKWDEERAREMEAHLQLEVDEFVARGMAPEEARFAAKRKLGNETRVREEIYEMNTVSWLDSLWQDLKYGARMLRKSPGYTAVAVLTLGLGIGANTTIFSLVNAVMLRSVPVQDAANLYVLNWRANAAPNMSWSSSFGDCAQNDQAANPTGCSFPFDTYEKVRDNAAVFSSAAAFAGPAQLEMSGNRSAKLVAATLVTGDFFTTLGVKPAVGRTLTAGDNAAGNAQVAVLSYAFWQHEFSGDPSVAGRTIELNKKAFTIAGVAEKSFTNLSPGKTEDLWIPIAGAQTLGLRWMQRPEDVSNWWLVVVARLAQGVTPAQAQTAATIAFRNELIHGGKPISKESDNPEIVIEKVQKGLVGERMFYSTRLFVLMGAVGLILLIACANVAGLLLARAAGRRKEIALRLALGAGRVRVIRQLLIESLLLSGLGAAAGVALAYWGVEAITPLLGGDPLRGFPFIVAIDWRVALFTVAAAALTGMFSGLAPAFRSTRVDLTTALKENAPTAAPVAHAGRFAFLHRLRRLQMGSALVVVQVALSVIVMIGAGLMVRTLEKLHHLDTGFDPHNVLLFGVDPTNLGMSDEQAQSLYREMRERFAALPGVTAASFSSFALVEGSDWTTLMRLDADPATQTIEVDMMAPGPNFLETMHIPLLAGRTFAAQDFETAAKQNSAIREHQVAEAAGKASPAGAHESIILPALANRAFVEKYLANQDPIGHGLYGGTRPGAGTSEVTTPTAPDWEIVGVVGNTKYDTMRAADAPLIFVPDASGAAEFEIRTTGDPNALVPVVRDAMAKINGEVPLIDIRTQTEQIDRELLEERFLAKLVSAVGLLAMLLACVGLYGLLSYEVSKRTREIGVRLVLGAARMDVFRLVLGQGLVLAVVGILLGAAVAAGLTRFLESLLFGVKPNDPATFAVIAGLILVVGAAASYLPTRRATRVDPMVALKYE